MSFEPLTGACMCGAVRFEIREPLVDARYCHCTRCQRRTGTAFSANGVVRPGTFAITAGEDAIATYRPEGGGSDKSFCARCGSALFARHPQDPDRVFVRLGVLDRDPGVRPSAHQFTAYAPDWAPVADDGLPRHPERMP